MYEKHPMQIYALWNVNVNQDVTLHFSLDVDRASLPVTQGSFFSNLTLGPHWARSRCPDDLGQAVGFTMTSNSTDFTLMYHMILQQQRRLRV
jgi:hypothetical protein